MSSITIPRSAARCIDVLAETGALITAKEWHRAAIVAALVGPAPGHGPGRGKDSTSAAFMPITALAQKGIVGLSSQHTVERYRDAWHIDAGRPTPKLGGKVNLDDLPDWPPTPNVAKSIQGERRDALVAQAQQDGTGQAKVLDIAQNPKAMAAAIKADPQVADAAAKALTQSSHPAVGKSPGAGEFGERVRRTNAASKGVVGNIGLARDYLRYATEEFEAHGDDLAPADRTAAEAGLRGVIGDAETLRMQLALDEMEVKS